MQNKVDQKQSFSYILFVRVKLFTEIIMIREILSAKRYTRIWISSEWVRLWKFHFLMESHLMFGMTFCKMPQITFKVMNKKQNWRRRKCYNKINNHSDAYFAYQFFLFRNASVVTKISFFFRSSDFFDLFFKFKSFSDFNWNVVR